MRYNVYTFIDLGYCKFKEGSTRKRFTSMAFNLRAQRCFPYYIRGSKGERDVSLDEAAIV